MGRFSSDPAAVSDRMRRIRSKETKPEIRLFGLLEKAGVRHVRHARVLGIEVDALVADTVLVFVDSPFWHLRDTRDLQRISPHWQQRLLRNRRRDRSQTRALRAAGYTVVRIWADLVGPETIPRIRRAVARAAAKRGRTSLRRDTAVASGVALTEQGGRSADSD